MSNKKFPDNEFKSSLTKLREVSVIIPAHNEENLIEGSIASVIKAMAALPVAVTSRCVLVADNCSDQTESIARRLLSSCQNRVTVVSAGCVGRARRAGVELCLTSSKVPEASHWLASTDADTTVPENWLVKQITLAERLSLEALIGIVTLKEDIDPFLLQRFYQTYPLPLSGEHRNVHAANMGFRASGYLAAGGWKDQTTNEDQDLYDRIAAIGPTAAPTDLVVWTSERTSARAPNGFAAYLNSLYSQDKTSP